MNKIAQSICKHKYLILIITLILMIPAVMGYINTKINYDILVYLPKDIETLKGEEILTDDFHMGAFSIVVVDKMNPKEILDLEDKFKNIDSVEHVFSLTDITGTKIPLEILPTKIVKKFSNGTSQLMLVTFRNSTSDDATLDAVAKMRKITDEKVKIGGMSAMVLDTKELFNSEMLLYVIIAVILCIIVLELFLDSYLIPILLMLNIGVAILFNMGSNIFLGNISYITKAIAAVLQLGVTTDFSIFLYHKYEKLKKEYDNKNEAMAIAIHDTFISVFGSSLTTIAGFLALCTMNLTLGSDIGIVMAKGVLIGVICVLTLFPALLLVFDKQIEKTSHKPLIPKFTHVKDFVLKNYKIIFVCFIILLIPAYICQSKTNVYYKLDESIPDNYGYSMATKTLKEDYNMVSQAIILIDKNKKDYELNNMIDEIERIDGVNKVISSSELSNLGITDKMVDERIKKIYETDKYKMILITSNYDIATTELNDQVDKIDKVIKKYDENAILAGEGPLMKDLVVITDQDFKNVNFTSIGVIFIIMLLVLKSVSLPVLLVTAIEFAIFINMGVPYLTNTTLPFIASVVIGTIQLGATIDYAILLTTKYLEERKTKDKVTSVKIALDTSITSIFVSAMCFFAATIGVGVVSKIDMIGSLCRLMSRGAIISMLVVMLIVPSILLIFDKLIIKTTTGFKKKEGKVMKNKKFNLAMLLVGLLLPLSVNAASKNETVYQVIGADGNTTTTVSEILEDISGDVIDESDLEDILNVNGDEKYFKDDNKLTWKSNGNNIYYQGITKKKLPIDIKIKYYLDDEETNVKKLAGKKGHIKIQIDYTNKEYHDGLYTPFVVTMGTIIKGNATHATISMGKVISNGTQNIAVGIASPGLSDSLNIDELDKLNSLTIEYDTESFEESDIYNVYSPNLLSDEDLKVFDKLDNIYDKVDTLSSSSKKLVNGSKKLADGTDKYVTNFKKYNEGISSLNNGVKKLNNGYKDINNGIIEINDNIGDLSEMATKLEALKNGLVSAVNGINQIEAGITDFKTSLITIGNNSKFLYNTLKDADLTSAGLDATNIAKVKGALQQNYLTIQGKTDNQYCGIEAGVPVACNKDLLTSIDTISLSLKEIKKGLASAGTAIDNEKLSELSKLVEGMKELAVGSQTFSDNLGTLQSKVVELAKATGSLYEASNTINGGMAELNEGMNKFDSEGIEKITNFVNNDVKSVEKKLKKLVDLGKDYDTFTKKAPGMKGETKFIVKIEA